MSTKTSLFIGLFHIPSLISETKETAFAPEKIKSIFFMTKIEDRSRVRDLVWKIDAHRVFKTLAIDVFDFINLFKTKKKRKKVKTEIKN